jgi:putative nucleotidyltransferase with HDIG domain
LFKREDVINLSNFNEEKAVARLAEIISLEYGVSPTKARQIRIAAALHDIGKQKISPSILNKPGRFTPEEFEIMKSHTTLGAEILSHLQGELGEMARLTALYHHEKYNGCGYWGKRTDELPYYVAITALSDVFAALLTGRPYKRPWPPSEALDYIQKQSGRQFSPALVDLFIPLIQLNPDIQNIFDGGII